MSHRFVCFRWLCLVLLQVSVALGGIEKLKNCGKRTSCRGKNPSHFDYQFNPQLGVSSPCHCDENCTQFGDCCLDIASYRSYGYTSNKTTENRWACIPLNLNASVFAVSNCELDAGPWKERCEKTLPSDKYSYILDIPIYSNITGLYYANIFCAYCHKQLTNVVSPRLSIVCTNNITIEMLLNIGIYKKGKLNWEVGNGFCSIYSDEKVRNGRPCVQTISDCPSDSDPILSSKCNAYSMILTEAEEMYRNPHCALCNGVNPDDLRCWYGNKYRTLPSLSMILGFDWNFDSCNVPESVWDGIQQKCTFVNCPIEKTCDGSTCNNSDTNNVSCTNSHDQLTLKIDGYITFICMSASVICLLFHMFISAFLPSPKAIPAKVLDSLAVSLMIAQSLFLCGIHPLFEVPNNICQTIAVLIQFFFLASFFWMNAMSIDIWSTFSNQSLKNNSTKSHTKYAFYAWGGATLVTTVSVIADLTNLLPDNLRPHYAVRPNVCWFGNSIGLAIFFYFPIFFILLLNTVLYSITVCWFQRHHQTSDTLKTSGRKEYNRLWLYIKLSTIMGTSWAFGMVTSITNMPNYRYPFTVLNGLQGVFIFIMFDLKTEVVRIFLKQAGNKFFRKKFTSQSIATNSTRLSTSSKGVDKL